MNSRPTATIISNFKQITCKKSRIRAYLGPIVGQLLSYKLILNLLCTVFLILQAFILNLKEIF